MQQKKMDPEDSRSHCKHSTGELLSLVPEKRAAGLISLSCWPFHTRMLSQQSSGTLGGKHSWERVHRSMH